MESIVISDCSSSRIFRSLRTPREVFLRSARLLPERRLWPLSRIGPVDLGRPLNHDFAFGLFLEDAEAVEFAV